MALKELEYYRAKYKNEYRAKVDSSIIRIRGINFLKIGVRCPKKGEYFYSGAIPTYYKAPNDLSMGYLVLKRLDT